ncbi:MAG TPA: DHHA1 domain-containing protein [Pyrinomonadaceae bacterium]|nr:DHHA1 domain-containing protein [Pyrinomonadaceae bacterium]
MPVTERLYYSDSHLIEFEARVVDVSERVSGWTAIVLDRTAFYPTGGGQPSDTGTLDGLRVVECIDDGDRGVLHVLQGAAPARDAIVRGRVDWPRRLDHMQQHTGQHILSQAFVSLFDAPTRGFRVLETVCEIDVDLKEPSTEKIERAVELANNVIWEDRVIAIRNVTSQEAAELSLRKEPSREGELRLIEIEGFDLTPCGGTHAFRTGEVGMIAVRSWERAKGMTRIEFVAGTRALADYRKANRSAREVAALFSAGRDDIPALASQVLNEVKDLQRRIRMLEELAAEVEASRLLASKAVGGVVTQVFEDRDAESLKKLAQALIANAGTIALLGSRDKDTARLVFARSADAAGDMNALMREACGLLDGRGGGKPELAQGGGKRVDLVADVIEQMRTKLIA